MDKSTDDIIIELLEINEEQLKYNKELFNDYEKLYVNSDNKLLIDKINNLENEIINIKKENQKLKAQINLWRKYVKDNKNFLNYIIDTGYSLSRLINIINF